MTRTLRFAFLLAVWLALPVHAQNLRNLTRATATTGVNDSALVLVNDSIFRTRAASTHELFKRPCGTAAKPAFSFGRDSTTGLYCFGIDTLGLATVGVARVRLGPTGLEPATNGGVQLGAASFRWSDVKTQGLNFSTVALGGNGSASAPSYSWASTTNLGFFRLNTDTIGIAGQGVQAGFIAYDGSATTLAGPSATSDFKIRASTGASGRLLFQTTTGAGAVKTTLTLGADTSATFLGAVSGVAISSSVPSGTAFTSDNTNAAGSFRTAFDAKRGGTTRWRLGHDGSDQFVLLNAAGSAANLTMTDVGAAIFNGALSGITTLAHNGKQTNSTTTAEAMLFNGQTTGTQYARMTNTSGDLVWGLASSTGTGLFSGNGNYASAIGSNSSTPFEIASGGIVRWSISSAGVATYNNRFIVTGDTLRTSSKIVMSGLTTEGSTQSTVCVTNGGGEVFINAASTCLVSASRYKKNVAPLTRMIADRIVFGLRPVTFTYKADNKPAIGLIAEQADSVNRLLVTRDPQGRVNSVNYEQITASLLLVVQRQQAQIDTLRAQVAALRK